MALFLTMNFSHGENGLAPNEQKVRSNRFLFDSHEGENFSKPFCLSHEVFDKLCYEQSGDAREDAILHVFAGGGHVQTAGEGRSRKTLANAARTMARRKEKPRRGEANGGREVGPRRHESGAVPLRVV